MVLGCVEVVGECVQAGGIDENSFQHKHAAASRRPSSLDQLTYSLWSHLSFFEQLSLARPLISVLANHVRPPKDCPRVSEGPQT